LKHHELRHHTYILVLKIKYIECMYRNYKCRSYFSTTSTCFFVHTHLYLVLNVTLSCKLYLIVHVYSFELLVIIVQYISSYKVLMETILV